ncbi:conserved domain protein [ [[Propionibacterium] namnetense SK182B-JCVI]|uniref:Conserved domain protein n=1 Tax=[Propionibacterium] namnetense SK182B-JCVI TaxID=1051006 RepID=F9NST2_9ACTN|nr:conserved domain protein [ [[Propionibacterium] namnetense SK182B-JCVI]
MLNLIVLGPRFQAGCASSLRMAAPSGYAVRRPAPMGASMSQQMLRVIYMKRA